MRGWTVVCGVVIAWIAAAPSGVADDLTGRWQGRGPDVRTIEHREDGTLLMRMPNHKTRKSMLFRGTYDKMGFLLTARLTSISQINPRFSTKVRRQIITQFPDTTYSYRFTPLDANRIRVVEYHHRVRADGTNSRLRDVRWNNSTSSYTLTRVTDRADLQVVNFACDLKRDAAGRLGWMITARVRNGGDVDVSSPWVAHLLYADKVISHDPGPPWRNVTGSWQELGKLAKGAEMDVVWETDVKVHGSTPPFVPDSARVLKVVVDPLRRIDETIETNNHGMLHRLACVPPDAPDAPMAHSLWIEEPAAGTEGGFERPEYRHVLGRMADKKLAVLCYIRMEAQRRAKQGPGSVADTAFRANLEKYFLKDYLQAPTADRGRDVVETLGRAKGIEGAPLLRWNDSLIGALGLYVPKSIRRQYPAVPERLFGATHFMEVRGFFRGDHRDKIPILDVPQLVGLPNDGVDADADVLGGGKNATQVMHWATGVKYAALPEGAMRMLFIGYEYRHLEGWDVFGEDAVNDLIAEEQGRMLGVRLLRGGIRSDTDLTRKIDTDFLRARKWVGAMLKVRREELDRHILAPTVPSANMWFGQKEKEFVAPWGHEKTARRSIHERIEAGESVEGICKSSFVERLVEIYTLIYEAKGNPDDDLGSTVMKLLQGRYDEQFKRSNKAWGKAWEWEE